MIDGGYYIKARKIQDSDISTAPPHVREIWDWLIKEVNHSDKNGIKRGSTMRSLRDIQEGLKWFIGYRKEMYSKSKCEMAMKWLRKHGMIATTKTTRGMIITICNYDIYQNPKNYETNNETPTKAAREKQPSDTINKNEEEEEGKEANYESWKTDFNIYLKECKAEYKKYINDSKQMRLQQRLNPNLDVLLTIEKGFQNFWGTEAGWKNKKRARYKSIDWKRTITNSIDTKFNRVYLQ